jgi:hypothetical protein
MSLYEQLLTEAEVGAYERFESDFMVQYLAVIASEARQSHNMANEGEAGRLPRRLAPRNDTVKWLIS